MRILVEVVAIPALVRDGIVNAQDYSHESETSDSCKLQWKDDRQETTEAPAYITFMILLGLDEEVIPTCSCWQNSVAWYANTAAR